MTAPNIGHLLCAWTRCTPSDIKRAAELQRSRPTERLGQILVWMEAVGRAEVDAALAKQTRLRSGGDISTADAMSLAEYAAQQLERASR